MSPDRQGPEPELHSYLTDTPDLVYFSPTGCSTPCKCCLSLTELTVNTQYFRLTRVM